MRGLNWFLAALIVAAALFVDAPAWHGAFLWDDPQYVTANPLLRDPGGLARAWFAPGSVMEFYPLQETVLWLQWRLFGGEPFGYHLTNALLHALSGLLLWRFFAQLGLKHGWVGALLFAVHPANVESVAWISELKNTLSLPPFLVAMTMIVRFYDFGRNRDYAIALTTFILAVLVKISMAPFPFVILLYAWWKAGRVTLRDVRIAAPFFFIAVVLAALTVFAYLRFGVAHPDHPAIPPIGGLVTRLALAATTVTFYFTHLFAPWPLVPIYPQWAIVQPPWGAFLEMMVWLAVLLVFWVNRATFGRHVLLGLGFFLLMIAPFSGLAAQSYMYFAWVMDHFLYIAMIGPLGLVVAGVDWVMRRDSHAPKVLIGAGLPLIVIAFVAQSHAYSAQWQTGEKLWSYNVMQTPDAWLAHYNLGNAYRKQGRANGAIAEYRASIALHPDFDWSHNNLGICLFDSGQLPEAIDEYKAALRLRPDFLEAQNNLGNALTREGHLNEAIAAFKSALTSHPEVIAVRYNLAVALLKAGRQTEAADQLREILKRHPDLPQAQALLEEAR